MRYLLILCIVLIGCAKKPNPTPVPTAPVAVEVPAPVKPRATPHVRNVMFAFDSDTVTARDFARIVTDCRAYPGMRMLIGYASNERSGKYPEKNSIAYNMALSVRRAHAVALAYTIAGCTDSRVAYFGESKNFGPLEENRRVTVE